MLTSPRDTQHHHRNVSECPSFEWEVWLYSFNCVSAFLWIIGQFFLSVGLSPNGSTKISMFRDVTKDSEQKGYMLSGRGEFDACSLFILPPFWKNMSWTLDLQDRILKPLASFGFNVLKEKELGCHNCNWSHSIRICSSPMHRIWIDVFFK